MSFIIGSPLRSESKKGKERSTHIIILPYPKEFPNLRRPLRAQPLRVHRIRQPRQFLISLLDNTQSQNRQIHRHDAPPDALPLALSGPSGPVAAVARGKEEANAGGVHDALLHGEALLVVAPSDFEDVAFEFGADAVGGDFLAHAAVHEDAEFTLVFNFDELLRAIGWVGDVEFHFGGWRKVFGGGKRSRIGLACICPI